MPEQSESWPIMAPTQSTSSEAPHSPPAPALPPRRYRLSADQTFGTDTSPTSSSFDVGESTLPHDTYANQLRQQARRYSRSRGSSFLTSKPPAPPNWRPPPPPVLLSADVDSSDVVLSQSTTSLNTRTAERPTFDSNTGRPAHFDGSRSSEDITCKNFEQPVNKNVNTAPAMLHPAQATTGGNGCRKSVVDVTGQFSICDDCNRTSVKSRCMDDSDDTDDSVGVSACTDVEVTSADNDILSRSSSGVGLLFSEPSEQKPSDTKKLLCAERVVTSNEDVKEPEQQPSQMRQIGELSDMEAKNTYLDVAKTDFVKSSCLAAAEADIQLRQIEIAPQYQRPQGRRIDTAVVTPCVRASEAISNSSKTLLIPDTDNEKPVHSEVCQTGRKFSIPNDTGSDKIPTGVTVMAKNFHRRRLSEETEYDRQSLLFAKRLRSVDKCQQLVDIISPSQACQTPMEYIINMEDGVVDQTLKESGSSESLKMRLSAREARHRASLHSGDTVNICSTGPTLSFNEINCGNRTVADWLTTGGLEKEKNNLIILLEKKLSALRQLKVLLEQEISENDALGLQVMASADEKLQSRERDKYQQFVRDVDKVTSLQLKLSDMLARADDAVRCLADDCDAKEKGRVLTKRDDLKQKHEDARSLKVDIGHRSQPVVAILYQSFSPTEFADYEYFILMKSQLEIERRDVEHAIQLGDQQLQTLHSSASMLALHCSDC